MTSASRTPTGKWLAYSPPASDKALDALHEGDTLIVTTGPVRRLLQLCGAAGPIPPVR
ncbi:hypothetical protein [Arthrobacter sp. Soil782]|uniref:hypothetical protein n=1 Tax=Arthrobacter sp. Soil782 TaxID=1736410 RepID=UPI0012FACAE8|nr:hypothetical protein [Arthrobacter sp. Soil782]